MSVVGRFEILSPVFSGAVDTSTARDPQTGDTVLLHLLPPGHEESPREFFLELAPGCPGSILDSGVDAETRRAFVVTDYPKSRKAVRQWIRELSGLPAQPQPSAPPATPPPVATTPKPAAEVQDSATRMFDPAAVFGNAPAAKPGEASPQVPSAVAGNAHTPAFDPFAAFNTKKDLATPPASADTLPGGGATRMFDPSAVFGAPAAAPAAAKPAPAVSDSGTRMFDPSAVFGAPAAGNAEGKKVPPPSTDGATRMFDPSAVFGSSASKPAESKPAPAASDSGTRMFDPSAVFGAPAAKPRKELTKEDLADSSKRAAEAFIHGRLPEEFRSAPTTVQRSPEEFSKDKLPPGANTVEPTRGRPGVITLMFDAYGRRIEKGDDSAPAAGDSKPAPPQKPEEAGAGATRMFSSPDLDAYLAATPSADAGPSSAQSSGQESKPGGSNPPSPQQGPPRKRN